MSLCGLYAAFGRGLISPAYISSLDIVNNIVILTKSMFKTIPLIHDTIGLISLCCFNGMLKEKLAKKFELWNLFCGRWSQVLKCNKTDMTVFEENGVPAEQEFKGTRRLCCLSLSPLGMTLLKRKEGHDWRNYLLLNWSVQLWDHLVTSSTGIQEYVLEYNLSEFGDCKNRFSFFSGFWHVK